jgi:hypothetical protein
MRFFGFEGDAQRLAGTEQMRLPDDVVERARTQRFGERRQGLAPREKLIPR